MSKLKIFITFLLLITFFASSSNANTYNRNDISELAKSYVEENLPIPAKGKLTAIPATIDSRIVLKPCSIPLKANIPENYSSRNVNVKISCESSMPWKIFIPVKVVTKVPAIVTIGKISKGTVIDESNIELQWIDLHKTRGEYYKEIQPLIGSRSKRTLSEGNIITKRAICVVCKGDNITIVAKSNDFLIKTAGIALRSATFGEQILVKNTRSGRTISAQVNTVNEVIINL